VKKKLYRRGNLVFRQYLWERMTGEFHFTEKGRERERERKVSGHLTDGKHTNLVQPEPLRKQRTATAAQYYVSLFVFHC
jgi:hypothetical protein